MHTYSIASARTIYSLFTAGFAFLAVAAGPSVLRADSVNSPNITLNVDTNRSGGAGAGNVSVTISTITIAETMVPEYTSGTGKSMSFTVRPGYQFDPTSAVTAQSLRFGINGGAINGVASVIPTGAANETITFNLTSGGSATLQDIFRFNGVKLRIISAVGAAGPAQTTMSVTTSTAGGAFTTQGIVAASITRGAADRLTFSKQPGDNIAAGDLLPEVSIVDFGGNVLIAEARTITLAIQTNPGSATLLGTAVHDTTSGVATWADADDLRITSAANGYVLQATHSGASFRTNDTVNTELFDITASNPGGLTISLQPVDTAAGADILISVATVDEFSNPTTANGIEVTLGTAINPGGWPLLVDSSLTKSTVNGVASWIVADHLRITKAIAGYKLSASGLGAPVTTNAFAIVSGAANALRFEQQPSGTKEDVVVAPPVTVEVIDLFGNRVETATTISLETSVEQCGVGISGTSATAVSGLATFSSLVLATPCSPAILHASASGLVGATSDEFNIEAIDAVQVAIASAELRPDTLLRFTAGGNFLPSKATKDDPTKRGGSLTVTGSTGSVRYGLSRIGWSAHGPRGFRFKGKKCLSVVITKRAIRANCHGSTGTITLPETDMDFVLALGKGTERFCGNCGGTPSGDESVLFQRTACAPPPACP